jgi:hypothetical protein
MTIRFLEADGGLPAWVFRPRNAILLTAAGLIVWLGSGDVQDYIVWKWQRNFTSPAIVECFGAPLVVAPPGKQLSDDLKRGFSIVEAERDDELKVLEAAAKCTVDSCTGSDWYAYRSAVRALMSNQAEHIKRFYAWGGDDGMRYSWRIMEGTRGADVLKDIREHIDAGVLDVRDVGQASDILSLRMAGDNEPKPCLAASKGTEASQ